MSIIKRGSSYRAAVYIDGRCVGSKCFAKKSDAVIWHDKTRTMYLNGHQLSKAVHFSQIIDEFKTIAMGKLCPSTARRYQTDLAHIKRFFGHLKLEHITAHCIERFQNSLIERDLNPRTVNHITDTLSLMLKKARAWGLANVEFSLAKLKLPKTDYRWFDDRADIVSFLAAAKSHRYYCIS